MENTFDYIIVGAGSAGCVMASRLTEDASVSVCLLEAGKKDNDFRIHIPAMLPEILSSGAIDWNYYTEPQKHLNNRRLFWPRGKTLGGSSSLNGMCYQRGDLSDYDDWGAAGAEGWSAMDALHYFKKSEDYSGGASQWHGAGGPLGVRKADWIHPATHRYVKAGQEAGHAQVEDFHGGSREGIGFFDTTIRDGKRCSAAKAYLTEEVLRRPNLTVYTEALVAKVEFDGQTASAVEATIKKEQITLNATQEIILSGGAINTPQLLLLSGIGPSAHLKEHNVSVVKDLPGVGSNLQDHLDVSVIMKTKPGTSFGYTVANVPDIIKGGIDYLTKKQGFMASNFAEGNGFAKSYPDVIKPDIQFHFIPAIGDDHAKEKMIGHQGFIIHSCNLYPKSRGTIRLASTNAGDHPVIDPNYLDAEEDWDVMIQGGKLAYEIARQPALKEITRDYYAPSEHPETRDDWVGFIKSRAETIYHPVGTCKMGAENDELAVADEQGRVYGAKNLRIVDASLMPLLIGGNTNAPTIMMAEKISDIMKAA